MAGQLQGGYYKNFNTFFTLGEVSVNLSPNKANGSGLWGWESTVNNQFVSTLSRNLSLGASGKIGLPINDKWGVFGSLGILNATFKFRQQFVDSGNVISDKSKNSNAWGIAPGIGFIYQTSANTMLQVGYSYEAYQTVTGPVISMYGRDARTKVNPHYHSLIASLSYKF